LAVAGAGALHGLNPATGWLFAAASRDRARALRALVPIAAGHAASVALVASAVALGMAMDRDVLLALAGVLLAALLLCRRRQAGLALWSFMMCTLHGAGLMLVPALIPLCLASSPAREITASGSLLLALAAVGVHMGAMLAVTGAVACMMCAAIKKRPPDRSGGRSHWMRPN
jgi:hypothetical protein